MGLWLLPSINPLHFQPPAVSLSAFQAGLSARLTQLSTEWMGKFEPHKNKEISLPVPVLQNDGSVRVGATLVTLAAPQRSRIRFACTRECAHVCELGHIQFSTPNCGRCRKASGMNHSWWRQGAEMDKQKSGKAGVSLSRCWSSKLATGGLVQSWYEDFSVLLFTKLC